MGFLKVKDVSDESKFFRADKLLEAERESYDVLSCCRRVDGQCDILYMALQSAGCDG